MVHDCKFVDVEVDGKKRSGRMVRVMLGGFNESVSVTIDDCEFSGNDGVTGVFFNSTKEDADDNYVPAEVEATIIDTDFMRNMQNNSESLIYFDLASASVSSFNVSINSTNFLSNHMQLVGGPLPAPSTVLFFDCEIESNSWFAEEPTSKGEQLPFYFIDIVHPAEFHSGSLVAVENNIENIPDSSTDPSYFSLLHVDTYDSRVSDVSVSLSNSYFTKNINCTGMLVTGAKDNELNIEVDNLVFERNGASVTVGISALALNDESSLTLTNCSFINNTVEDTTLLTQWGYQGSLVRCGGKGAINIEGARTHFLDDNTVEVNDHTQDLRDVDGTCKKTCDVGDAETNTDICGRTGITTATIVFSCVLGISCLGLFIYHIVYVVVLLPKRRKEAEYQKLVN